jgi:hypothetical protein
MGPGPNVMKPFTYVINNVDNKLAYVPGKIFQTSPQLAGKARAYPSEAHARCSTRWTPGLTQKH